MLFLSFLRRLGSGSYLLSGTFLSIVRREIFGLFIGLVFAIFVLFDVFTLGNVRLVKQSIESW